MSQAAAQSIVLDAIVDASVLTDWIETFRSVVDEARIHVSSDGLYAIPVDAANVAMVEQTLHAEAFESYSSGEVTIGVDLETFQDYVEAGDADLVHLKMDAERGVLEINCGSVSLEMACIDPETIRADGDIPEVELPIDATIDAGAFAHAIDVVGMVSDHVAIDGDPDRESPIMAIAKGDTDTAEVEFDNSVQEGSTVARACESLFSHDYLDDLTGEIPSGADLHIQAGDELPMKLGYEYADGAVECLMMCAPRIEKS